jgi:Ser/Thr protein kinase RdoA (MazF antagonist)
MKAVFSIFWHEPAVTSELAARHPGLVPDVIATDPGRGWMLLRELTGKQLGETDAAGWSAGLAAMATLQRAWIGKERELRALGAQDRTLAVLARDLEDASDTATLPAEVRERYIAALPALRQRLEELGRSNLPQTLIHGDLHPWNVMLDGESLHIFDWSDACVSHPFFDLATFLPRVAEEDVRTALLDGYLAHWTDYASLDDLRRLFALAEPLAQVHHATSYVRILEALEPDDRWWFADVPRQLLGKAVEAIEAACRPSGIAP